MARASTRPSVVARPAPSPPALPPERRLCLGVILAAGLLHFGLGWSFLTNASATFDEPVHLAAGYSYLTTGVYRLNIKDHPPLAEMWAAVPLLALRPASFLNHPDYAEGRKYHLADHFLYRNRLPASTLLTAARAFSLATWTVVTLACLAWWAWRLEGPRAAAAASALFAFTPALFSNAALVTTDAGSAALFFAAFALLSAAFESPTPTRWALSASAACGLAMASKFNMAALPALLAGLLGWDAWRRAERRPGYFHLGVIVLTGAALALGLAYRFQLSEYFAGLTATASRLQEGRSSFFLGRHATTGFLWYFPFAFAAKTPLALLALGVGGLGWVAARRTLDLRWHWAVLPMVAYMAAALAVKVQIGHRHLLPVYPFWLLIAGAAAARLMESRGGLAAALGLLAFQAVSVLRVQPHALSYFNEAVGGPSAAHRLLVDSNLDWGQALPALSAELEKRGGEPVYLAFFGTADPAEHGVRYHPVAMASAGYVDRPGNASPTEASRIRLAVSATHFQSTYFRDKDVFRFLHGRKPEAVAGYSILLFDLTGDAEARESLAKVLELDGQPREAERLRRWAPR